MTTDKEPGHDLPDPQAVQQVLVKPRLADAPPPRAGRLDLFWLLVAAAVAATGAGVYLALDA